MSKYSALAQYLSREHGDTITLSFSDLERILGFRLPESARRLRVWWSNDDTHPQARSGWLAAGYIVKEVNLELERVTFERTVSWRAGMRIFRESDVAPLIANLLRERYGELLFHMRVGGKTFDLVSKDGKSVGEIIPVRSKAAISAYLLSISGHVWHLEKTNVQRKFIVFCGERSIAEKWIARFGHFVKGITFYYFNGTKLEELFRA